MKNGIPASVTAQAKRSEELINQLNETPKAKDEDGKSPATPDDSKAPGNTSPVDAQATADTAQDATPAATPADDGFQAKYLSLQGKYNAEIPRLHESVRTLQQQVEALTAENARLKEAGDQDINTDHQDGDAKLDPDSMIEYGPEFKEMAAQLNKVIEENSQLKQQVKSMQTDVGDVKQIQGQSAYETYIGQVADQVKEAGGDFAKLNSDPDFLAWLSEVHPYTGQPRHASLQEAERHLDVNRSMVVFNEYLNSLSSSSKKASPKTSQPNIQPDNAGSGTEQNPAKMNSGRLWNPQMVSKLYAEKAAGKWKHKEAEFKALEADMFAAQEDGRMQA